jgi:hypothetical protein
VLASSVIVPLEEITTVVITSESGFNGLGTGESLDRMPPGLSPQVLDEAIRAGEQTSKAKLGALVLAELVSYDDTGSVRDHNIHKALRGGHSANGGAVHSLPHEEISTDSPLHMLSNRGLDIGLQLREEGAHRTKDLVVCVKDLNEIVDVANGESNCWLHRGLD